MKRKFLLLYSWLIRSSLYFLPDAPLTAQFRGWLYGLGMKKCGKNLQVQHDSILRNLEILEFGSNVFIGNHAFIMGSGSIILENDVMIAPHSVIIAGNHTLAADGYRNGPARKGTIIIKRGSWIAANCTVAIGAVLPEMSVLGANSMLNKAFDTPSAIYAGVPAKLIKVVGQ